MGPLMCCLLMLTAVVLVGCAPSSETESSPTSSDTARTNTVRTITGVMDDPQFRSVVGHLAANPEQTQGEVRVIFMRLAAVASPTNPPSVEVTYAVEVPKEGAFADVEIQSNNEIQLSTNGKRLGQTGGISSGAMAIDALPRWEEMTKPTPQPGKALLGIHVVLEETRVSTKNLDVKIQFLWRGSPLVFTFKEVPVRSTESPG